MTRNQLLPKYAKNLSGGVIFTVDSKGNVSPDTQQTVNRGDTISLQVATGETFSGYVCAQQNDVCQCSTLLDGVSSGNHMAIGSYMINMSVAVDSEFEVYAVPDSGPVAGATNGDIYIGG